MWITLDVRSLREMVRFWRRRREGVAAFVDEHAFRGSPTGSYGRDMYRFQQVLQWLAARHVKMFIKSVVIST